MDKTVVIQPESGLQYNWKAIASNPSARHEPQIDLVAYKALYTNRIAQVRASGQEPVLVSLPIIDENRYFAYITRGMTTQERKNLLFWLGGNSVCVISMRCIIWHCSAWQHNNVCIWWTSLPPCCQAPILMSCLIRMEYRSLPPERH